MWHKQDNSTGRTESESAGTEPSLWWKHGVFTTGPPGKSLEYSVNCASETSAIQEMQVRSLGREDPLEEEMATHTSILVWRISWAEESGRLLSIGSQRVEHNWGRTHLEGSEQREGDRGGSWKQHWSTGSVSNAASQGRIWHPHTWCSCLEHQNLFHTELVFCSE